MDKPLPEDAIDTDLAMSVEEDGNPEEQNIELSNTVAYIKKSI